MGVECLEKRLPSANITFQVKSLVVIDRKEHLLIAIEPFIKRPLAVLPTLHQNIVAEPLTMTIVVSLPLEHLHVVVATAMDDAFFSFVVF
jgi:hypothetical protein